MKRISLTAVLVIIFCLVCVYAVVAHAKTKQVAPRTRGQVAGFVNFFVRTEKVEIGAVVVRKTVTTRVPQPPDWACDNPPVQKPTISP